MAKDYTIAQLKEMAKKKKITGYSKLRKQELMNVLGLGGGRGGRHESPKPQSPKPQSPKPQSPKPQVRKPQVRKPIGNLSRLLGKPLPFIDSCPLSDLKKYANRPGPPRPANDPGCRDQIRRGNDGLLYASMPNKNGVYSWVKWY